MHHNKVIGVLGGGQLGRMTALAAANFGYKTHIFAPEAESCAADVSATWTQADYTNKDALTAFANSVDVITLEFENVPTETLDFLATLKPVYPSASVLRTTQDRLLEKEAATALGLRTAPFITVNSLADMQLAVEKLGLPLVLKTRCFGYDGKGQRVIKTPADIEPAYNDLCRAPLIAEGFINFTKEISTIVARTVTGETAVFPIGENVHQHHILHTTTVPANITAHTQQQAIQAAEKLANALNVVGLLAVEFFVTPSGDVLVNEMAPRPHNSGHWSMNGCKTSQFEQLVRCITGLPLGSVTINCEKAVMQNILGIDALNPLPFLDGHLHLYGKSQAKAGRKMGHVNYID